MKLLVTYNIPREPFQNLPADWEITFPEKEEFSKTELLRILPDYDIMLAIFHAPIDRKIIDAGKKLKLISNYGVGYNNIDITYAYWLLLGLGFAICKGSDEHEQQNV